MGAGDLDYKQQSQQIEHYTGGLSTSLRLITSPHDLSRGKQQIQLSSFCLKQNMHHMFKLWSDIFNKWDTCSHCKNGLRFYNDCKWLTSFDSLYGCSPNWNKTFTYISIWHFHDIDNGQNLMKLQSFTTCHKTSHKNNKDVYEHVLLFLSCDLVVVWL